MAEALSLSLVLNSQECTSVFKQQFERRHEHYTFKSPAIDSESCDLETRIRLH
jgi:hypothetical protein